MTDANKEWSKSWGHEREQAAAAGTPPPSREALRAQIGALVDTIAINEQALDTLAARLRESERERRAVTSAARKLLRAIGDYLAADAVSFAADRLRDALRPSDQHRPGDADEPAERADQAKHASDDEGR